MVRFSSLSAAAAAFLAPIISAVPTSYDRSVHANNLLGFDESAITNTTVLPSLVRMAKRDVSQSSGNSSVPGFIPAHIKRTSDVEKRFINGNDDRYQYTDRSNPWNMIGRLSWSNGVICSGSMIGPRHVLTAKHCWVDGQTGTFTPSLDNGEEPFGHGTVTNVVMSGYEWGTPCGWKGDWMVLVLDQRLGDNIGYFGVKLPDPSLQDQAIFDHVGYPGDLDGGNRPYRVNGNTILSSHAWDCDAGGPYYTDTDCMGGQSGGPHFQNAGVAGSDAPYIWGTLSVTLDYGNGVAVSGWGTGQEMLDAVINIRNDYP